MKKLFILLLCCVLATVAGAQTQKKSATGKTTTTKTTAKKSTTSKKTAATTTKKTTAKKTTAKKTTAKKAATTDAKTTNVTATEVKKSTTTTTTNAAESKVTAPEDHAAVRKTTADRRQIARSFGKGQMLVNGGLGFGIEHSTGHTGCMFNQKVSFEYGIAQLGRKGSLSIGAAISNSWGDMSDGMITGKYDYDYTLQVYRHEKNNANRWIEAFQETKTQTRSGTGTADCKVSSDAIKLMVTSTYHYQFKRNFEGYATIGLGVGILCSVYGSKDNYNGFSAQNTMYWGTGADGDEIHTSQKTRTYFRFDFDDRDHVEWDGADPLLGFAAAACVGGRWYVSDHLGIYGEVGMTSGVFRKDGQGIDLLSVGCTYKF